MQRAQRLGALFYTEGERMILEELETFADDIDHGRI